MRGELGHRRPQRRTTRSDPSAPGGVGRLLGRSEPAVDPVLLGRRRGPARRGTRRAGRRRGSPPVAASPALRRRRRAARGGSAGPRRQRPPRPRAGPSPRPSAAVVWGSSRRAQGQQAREQALRPVVRPAIGRSSAPGTSDDGPRCLRPLDRLDAVRRPSLLTSTWSRPASTIIHRSEAADAPRPSGVESRPSAPGASLTPPPRPINSATERIEECGRVWLSPRHGSSTCHAKSSRSLADRRAQGYNSGAIADLRGPCEEAATMGARTSGQRLSMAVTARPRRLNLGDLMFGVALAALGCCALTLVLRSELDDGQRTGLRRRDRCSSSRCRPHSGGWGVSP